MLTLAFTAMRPQAGGCSYGRFASRLLRRHEPSLKLLNCSFLKMADERTKAPYNQKSPVPEQYSWPVLVKKDGDELFDHYRHTLEALGNQKGLLGPIFNKSQNKFDSRCFTAALTLRAPIGVQSPMEIVGTRPSGGG